jgi:putative salt-induced outer membrane protein YdiY
MVRSIAAIAAVVALCAQAALADQVRLKNGDTITGTINYYDGGQIRVAVDYLEDDLVLELEDLASFDSEQTLIFEFKDGREVEGRLRLTEAGDVVVVDPSGNQIPYDAAQLVVAEPPADWFRISGAANVGLAISSGNTDTQSYHIDGIVEPILGRNTFRLSGQLNRDEAKIEQDDGSGRTRTTTASNWRLLAQYERELTYRLYAFAANSYDNDDLLGLNVRVTAGGGLGYKVFQTAPRHLRFELGPAYVHENWREPTPDEDYAAARWALYFDHEVFTPDLVFYHSHVYLQSLQEGSRFTVQTVTGLRYALVWNLFGALEGQYDWNNQPAEGAQEDDLRVYFKLGYAF